MLVGAGKRTEAWVADVLAAETERLAGPTAPAKGLFLVKVRYGRSRRRPLVTLVRRHGPRRRLTSTRSKRNANRSRHHAADHRRRPGEHAADGPRLAPALSRRCDLDHRAGRRARRRSVRPRERNWARNVEVLPELVRPIRPIVDLKAYRRLRAAFRHLEPEVVHTHSSKAGILGRAAAWHEKVPAVVHTIHGMPFGEFETPLKNRLYIALERWAARRCHAIVSVCDAMTEQALAAGVGRPDQFLTVYSGMNADAFLDPPRPRQDVRRELGLADDEVAFATVARLFELKGHDDIVAVAADVVASNPKVRFVWIGDGILRDRLIADLEGRGIRGSFILTGLVPPDRIPELLGAVDAVIHPSLREGLARVLPQALLGGTPRDQLRHRRRQRGRAPRDGHPA